MSSIKERLEKMRRETKERSRQLSQKDLTSDFQNSASQNYSAGSGNLFTETKELTPHFNKTTTETAYDENTHTKNGTLNVIIKNTPHSLEQSTSRYYSSSCSKLAAVMETPASSTAGSVISSSKISKSLSSGNIYNNLDKRSNNNNLNRNGGTSGNSGNTQRLLRVSGKCYSILNCIGKGGSSCVYQAFSIIDKDCVAIKCVDLTNADDVVRNAYENEIELLETLQGSPYVVKMFDYEKRNNRLYVVMERGDIDLATFMQKKSDQIDAKFIKYHWQEMLRCVKVIHDMNIVHSDLKPANFLFVGASLKLIDFGIASNIPSNKTSIVKDVQIGTLNYMSPEAISGFYTSEDGSQLYKIPLKSDVWSLGCILHAMVYGQTPFQHLPNQIAKIQAISSSTLPINLPPIKDELLRDVIKRCLVRNVKKRASIDELLQHPYLNE